MLPLIPYLHGGIQTFAEPCCGDGDLVRHLESFGLACVYAGDIQHRPGCACARRLRRVRRDHYQSALSRDVMHRLIDALPAHRADVAAAGRGLEQTRQAAPFLPHCSDIVTIGRVKWIEGSKHTGKDNFPWYRFDSRHKAGPVFHWRDQGEVIPSSAPAFASNAASAYEPCSDPVRGSARRRAGSAPIARGLA